MYKLRQTKRAVKDSETCRRSGFDDKLDEILDTIEIDPYKPSQGFERLAGNLKGIVHVKSTRETVYFTPSIKTPKTSVTKKETCTRVL